VPAARQPHEVIEAHVTALTDQLARIIAAGLGGELGVGREQLRVLARAALLGADELVEPVAQTLRCRALAAATRANGAEISANQRSATASRSAALLGKWR
jgi:hypothetical protein